MKHSRPALQRGVAALMTVLFLLFMLLVVLVIAHQMAATDVHDSGAQNLSVEALFLAESGLERAAQLYDTGTLCGGGLMEGALAFGSGEFEVIAPTPFPVGSLCRVRVAGRVGSVVRIIEGDLTTGFAEHFPSSADFVADWTTTLINDSGCTPSGGYGGYSTTYGNAPGSYGGHVFATSCPTTDRDRYRYRIERSLGSASFTATAGTPINATFYWRKTSNDTGGAQNHLLRLSVLTTTNQSQVLWSDTVRTNMAGWQYQAVSLLPTTGGGGTAGRIVNRVELYFDLEENNPAGNPDLFVAGGFDFIQFGGGGGTAVQAWREIVQ